MKSAENLKVGKLYCIYPIGFLEYFEINTNKWSSLKKTKPGWQTVLCLGEPKPEHLAPMYKLNFNQISLQGYCKMYTIIFVDNKCHIAKKDKLFNFEDIEKEYYGKISTTYRQTL